MDPHFLTLKSMLFLLPSSVLLGTEMRSGEGSLEGTGRRDERGLFSPGSEGERITLDVSTVS